MEKEAITVTDSSSEYDEGVHPEVKTIMMRRRKLRSFFEEDRFPHLRKIIFYVSGLRKVRICSRSLRTLYCRGVGLEKIYLECPRIRLIDLSWNNLGNFSLSSSTLTVLIISDSSVTSVGLDCPALTVVDASSNMLTNISGFLQCPFLEKLDVRDNPIKNFNGIEFLGNLIEIGCDSEQELLECLEEDQRSRIKFSNCPVSYRRIF